MALEQGKRMYKFCEKIFPYTRSITGQGVRETLKQIKENLGILGRGLKVYNVPTGTQVFDWKVPKEWRIQEAFIEDETGKHIIDMKVNNLHVLGYSIPVDKWVDLKELKKYIYTQPDQPNVIPYVTSYYKERFGFCMSQNQLDSLSPGKYHMVIKSELFDGVLNYAELVLPGDTEKEVFFSTYFCHPSMANNECSGPTLAAEIIKFIAAIKERRYTYRFIFIPETIGSITYLSHNNHLIHLQKNMIAGFNLTCVGDNNDYSIVETKYGNTLADRALNNILHFHTNGKYSKYSYLQRGSDERQYNAPGVDLPVVCYCRSKFHEFPEYHTSADNMSFVSPEGFQGSFDVITKLIYALEANRYYKVQVLGEPQLGKRGLYPTTSQKGSANAVKAMTDFIAYADGTNDLFAISESINVPIWALISTIKKLEACELIKAVK